MKMNYFDDTDTLYIQFSEAKIVEPKDLDENTLLEVDENGNMVAITMEHASKRAEVSNLSLSGIAA
jgi:uncharacterized protein YuzE